MPNEGAHEVAAADGSSCRPPRTATTVDPDRLVHRHIKAVDDFVREVFPCADPDLTIDEVFARAAAAGLTADDADIVCRLFGFAIDIVRTSHPSGAWWIENAAWIEDSIRRSAGESGSAAVRAEASRSAAAVAALSVRDQFVLRMLVVSEMSDRQMSIVLGLDETSTARIVGGVRHRFRTACEAPER
ncbi:MAG: hypothetical protein JWM34_4133 [Ilumatobacteraceae bacterium]|nr:hypothetical protein [Ilumatobacteraceae bacterium]